MARWIILVDQYGNETKLPVPSGLTTPVVGWDGVDKPEWIEAPSGGGGSGLLFTGEGRTQLVNASSAVSVGNTTVASGAPDGSTAVQLELWVTVTSGTPDPGNLLEVKHGVTGNAAAIVRSPSTVAYFHHIQCTVALDASEQFQYSLTRVNGTIGYRIYRVGYWKSA